MNVCKKLFALMLALMLIVSAVPTAKAAGGTIDMTGNSTLVYDVFKLFDIEIAQSGGYKYKKQASTDENTNPWDGFTATGYFTYDTNGYVLWAKDTVSSADAAAIAQLAREYAENNNITTEKTVSVQVDCTDLENGYYLLVPKDSPTASGVVAVVGNEKVTVTAKTEEGDFPTVEKLVWEDSNQRYQNTNDVDIGQEIRFMTTITTGANPSNYVLHDIVDPHITIDPKTLSITRGGNPVSATYYDAIEDPECKDDCSFHIEFKEEFCKTLNPDAKIVITYNGKLVNDAAVDTAHCNTAWLTHTTNIETERSTTETMTYKVVVKKFDNQENPQPLAGAGFVLKDNIGLYYKMTEKGVEWVANIEDASEYMTTVGEGGTVNNEVTFYGVDGEVFTLIENTVPGGYIGTTEITVNTKVLTVNSDSEGKSVHSKEVIVKNHLGTALPETGGVGTTLFYVIGGLLSVAAVVLLVAKKRVEA